MPTTVDQAEDLRSEREDAVRLALRGAESYIRNHAGSVELLDLSGDGVVTVKFGGMCTGCPARPVTLTATIKRCLEHLPFVTSVRASGISISAEAQARVARYINGARESR